MEALKNKVYALMIRLDESYDYETAAILAEVLQIEELAKTLNNHESKRVEMVLNINDNLRAH